MEEKWKKCFFGWWKPLCHVACYPCISPALPKSNISWNILFGKYPPNSPGSNPGQLEWSDSYHSMIKIWPGSSNAKSNMYQSVWICIQWVLLSNEFPEHHGLIGNFNMKIRQTCASESAWICMHWNFQGTLPRGLNWVYCDFLQNQMTVTELCQLRQTVWPANWYQKDLMLNYTWCQTGL